MIARIVLGLVAAVGQPVHRALLSRISQTPVSGPSGEAGPEAGHAPEGEGGALPARPHARVPGGTPTGPRPPVSHPELVLDYRPSADVRGELNDMYLAGAIAQWKEQVQ